MQTRTRVKDVSGDMPDICCDTSKAKTSRKAKENYANISNIDFDRVQSSSEYLGRHQPALVDLAGELDEVALDAGSCQ